MKTLIVQYIPRDDYSHTGKILSAFKEKIVGEVQTLDLLKDVPDYFDNPRIMAYINQNYLGQTLSDTDKALLKKMEGFANDVKAADFVVLATPMHNFSYPALVKAWFDSVMLKDITWKTGEGGYEGLCTKGKAALLYASGGSYEGEAAGWDHLTPIVAQSFGFMGFGEFNTVTAGGLNLPDCDQEKIVQEAQQEARELADSWYNV